VNAVRNVLERDVIPKISNLMFLYENPAFNKGFIAKKLIKNLIFCFKTILNIMLLLFIDILKAKETINKSE
jgi:hypothetical protein